MDQSKGHILVVEDNAAFRKVVKLVLQRAGFEVTTAANGALAWDLAQQTLFDLIVTDQQMPVMEGLELCKRIRSDERYRDIPVFMLTAKGLELDLPALRRELGITGTFAKPVSPAMLVKAVDECLAGLTKP